jgi:hypothetical protein
VHGLHPGELKISTCLHKKSYKNQIVAKNATIRGEGGSATVVRARTIAAIALETCRKDRITASGNPTSVDINSAML